MAVIFFAFLATLVLGYPSNVPRDGSAEDMFSTSNLNPFDDISLIPSLAASEDHTSSSNILEPDASTFTADFLQDYSPVGQPLTNINEGQTQTLFGDPLTQSDSSFGNFNSLVATTSDGSEYSASTPGPNCDSSALDSGDLLADYDSNEDSLFTMSDPSVSVANADDNVGMFNLRGRAEPRYRGGSGGGGGVYIPVQRYELDPNTSPDTPRTDAWAADGTPISPMNCPNGSKKTCCVWDAIPPFSQCWAAVNHAPPPVCRFAKNLFCCADVTEQGGAGINCQPIQWSKARDGRRARDPSTPQGPTSNPFEDVFPILRPLPDLTPNSDFCSPRRRA